MESRDGKIYYKTIPQSSVPVLGLNIREDGTHPHAYFYQYGSEVDKQQGRIDIPEDYVKRIEYSSSKIFVKLPETAATVSYCAWGSNYSSMSIDRDKEGVLLESKATATIWIACFDKKNEQYYPIPFDD